MSQLIYKGKVILITGAASGIGAATAKKFAELGSILSLLDLQPDQLKEVVEQCYEIGKKFQNPKPYFLVGDVTNDDTRKQYVVDTIKNFGHIDILFNNAGVIKQTNILTTPMSEFDKLFNINVRAVYDMCHLTAPHLIKTKGCIVNVSSIAAYKTGNVTIYAACKAAVKQMTKSLADEFGCHQVRVVAITPGPTRTSLFNNYGKNPEEIFTRWGKLTLVDRYGLPAEIANLVAFLTSKEANFINGTDVIIDGGLLAKRRI